MGNTFQSPVVRQQEQESMFVTKQERQNLQRFYATFSQNGNLSTEKLVTVFEAANPGNEKPMFRECLTTFMLTNCRSYENFESFIVDCTRQSTTSTITAFWKLTSQSQESSKPSALHRFLLIVLELSMSMGIQLSEKKADATVSRLQEFIELKGALSGNHSSETEELNHVLSVMNQYIPNMAKVLESYISRVCFGDLLSPSYKLFSLPVLDTPSEIVDECDLLPLALHSEALQGSWKRLYSTSVDGLSFNRIAYHVLGYDGPTCMLIKCQDPQSTVLGFLAHDRWKDSNRFFGTLLYVRVTIYVQFN